ncbi:MAG: YegS/Rv2252/BmrU family lipid kinase [Ilumatobacteraceae bacterium]
MATTAVIANTEKIDRKDVHRLRQAVQEHLGQVKWYPIEKGSAAKQATLKALDKGATTVVVAGGDGTVRAAAEALVGTDTALAVVPRGTANLFAGGLGLPTDIDEIIRAVAGGERRSIDTALCNDRTFCVMAGVGFDVKMLDGAEDDKERLGTLAYVRSGVREARARKRFTTKVAIDGVEFFEGEATCVLVGNAGHLKGGLDVFPGATVTDGRLHVAVVTAANLREWGGLLVAAALRRPHWSSNSLIGDGTKIEVSFDKRRRFEMDGGVKTKVKQLDVEVLPRSLLICSPAAPTN